MDDSPHEFWAYEKVPSGSGNQNKEKLLDTNRSEQTRARPIIATTILSSSMLSDMNWNDSTSSKLAPERQTKQVAFADAQDTPLLSRTVPSDQVGSSTERFDSNGLLQDTIDLSANVASNLLNLASSVPVETLKAAENILHIAHLEEAVHVIADFLPVVGGGSGAGRDYSLLRRSDHPMDSVDTDELLRHPLHHCCALSATAGNSATTKNGSGNLASVKRLVESDPTGLQERLPTSKDTPLHIAIQFGAMQWHQMSLCPDGTSNLAVIEYLIQAEIDFLRKLAVQQRRKDGSKNPLRMEDLILQSALYKQDINGNLPLHVAAAGGFEGAARILLKFDKDAGFKTIAFPGHAGNLPLHMSVLRDHLRLVQLLLAADCKRDEQREETRDHPRKHRNKRRVHTIFEPNDDGDLPIHLALASHLKFDLWDVLLTPDDRKETLYVRNRKEMDALHYFVNQPRLFKDEHEFVEKHLAQPLLQRLLSGKRMEPWDGHLKHSVARSQDMQLMMNNAAANRLPVIIFMADFYAHVLSISALFLGTNHYFEAGGQEIASWILGTIFTMAVYFSVREFIQLLLSRSMYWRDFWNYIDLVRIAMLMALTFVLEGRTKASLDGLDEEYSVRFIRQFLLALAVFMYLGFISFLRITYLQFALFVGGIARILITLIPFMVTFFLVLCVFAYGYWVGGYESNYYGGQFFGQWLLELFLSSLSGPDDLATMGEGYINNAVWTSLFMILVQILLLNVLIAVLSSEWEDITDRQNEVFWQYRLGYAGGVLPVESFLQRYFGATCFYRCVETLARLIDSLEDKPIVDKVDWHVAPFSSVVRDPSLYWDKARLQLLMLEKLKERQDTERTPRSGEEKEEMLIAKVQKEWRQMRSFEADGRFARSGCHKVYIRLKLLFFYFLWTVSFVLGFATLGFCWPRSLRRFFCAPSTTRSKNRDEQANAAMDDFTLSEMAFFDQPKAAIDARSTRDGGNYEALEMKIDGMIDTVEKLQKTVEALVKLHSGPGKSP